MNKLRMTVENPKTNSVDSEEIRLEEYHDLHLIVDRYLQLGLKVTLELGPFHTCEMCGSCNTRDDMWMVGEEEASICRECR